jgi:hypothetical protein
MEKASGVITRGSRRLTNKTLRAGESDVRQGTQQHVIQCALGENEWSQKYFGEVLEGYWRYAGALLRDNRKGFT